MTRGSRIRTLAAGRSVGIGPYAALGPARPRPTSALRVAVRVRLPPGGPTHRSVRSGSHDTTSPAWTVDAHGPRGVVIADSIYREPVSRSDRTSQGRDQGRTGW